MTSFGRIIGIGVDMASISRMHQLLAKHGEKFVKRIFHPSEIQQCPLVFSEAFATCSIVNNNTTSDLELLKKQQLRISQYYASRWAAKEATIKALGVSGIGSKQMFVYKNHQANLQILNNSITKLYPPLLKLEGSEINKIIKIALEEKHANDYVTHLSLSHEGDLAIANVIIEAIYTMDEINRNK